VNSKPETQNSKLKVLLIEDNPADARLVQEILHDVGSSAIHVQCADRLSAGLQCIADGSIDAVLLDLSLPDSQGFDTFARAHTQAPHLPIIVLSGLADEALAVKAVAEGAQDYVVKGQMDGALLGRAIRYAIERRRLTAELERGQRQQLEIKDQFLSHVSHELRSPLTAVLQFVSIILDGLAGEINEEQREYLTITLRNAKQLHKMISELLEVIRSDTGKLAFDLRSVPLAELTSETVGMLLSHAAAKGVFLSADVPADLPPVYADPERLRQILINLIDNAIKFTPAKGTITVRASVFAREPDFACVAVADTGCGISPENTRRIFERLYQEPSATETERRGLGLGLHICKELTERQGGRIWVESDLGKGSVFTFTVPIFSLAKLLHPVITQDGRLRNPIGLITVELFPLHGAPETKITETMRREARNTVQQCIVPDKNTLLPRMSHAGESELLYIVECSGAEELEATAQSVRQRCKQVKELQDPNVDVTVSITVVEMPSTETHPTLEEQVRSACARITELTKAVGSKKPKESAKDLYGIISAKVRTPLSVVIGYAGILQDKLLGELNPEQENALGKVLGYANDLAAMINNVVEAQRIEAGNVKVEHAEVAVTDLLDELKSAYELPRTKSVAITWNTPNELPAVITDRGKLKTILQNLMNNAIKFTEQGRVTVSARVREGNRQQAIGNSEEHQELATNASCLMPNAFIEFQVADTGMGIPKEELANIFASFRQLQNVEVNPSSGMGFGLYIVKAFTELLGGQVAVESEYGKGSVFTVTIPCL
jgi:signal transduction histidine kinase